jgi:AcrR family transcriptional regulator
VQHPSERHRDRSEAILASAVAAFRQHGFHGTSMQQIAEALRMQKGSLYYYFHSKAEILFEAHDRALDRMQRALDQVERDGQPAAEQLRELVRMHSCAMVDGFHGTALALELDALQPESRRRLIDKRDRYEEGLRRIIERGVRAGEFGPVDARLAGFALLGTINWMARWYRPGGGLDADRLGDVFASLFLEGLKRRPSPEPEPRRAVPRAAGQATNSPA